MFYVYVSLFYVPVFMSYQAISACIVGVCMNQCNQLLLVPKLHTIQKHWYIQIHYILFYKCGYVCIWYTYTYNVHTYDTLYGLRQYVCCMLYLYTCTVSVKLYWKCKHIQWNCICTVYIHIMIQWHTHTVAALWSDLHVSSVCIWRGRIWVGSSVQHNTRGQLWSPSVGSELHPHFLEVWSYI
jgi:hypothetical protein